MLRKNKYKKAKYLKILIKFKAINGHLKNEKLLKN